MPSDETKPGHLPGASAGRGPPLLVPAGPQAPLAKHSRFSPYHSS